MDKDVPDAAEIFAIKSKSWSRDELNGLSLRQINQIFTHFY